MGGLNLEIFKFTLYLVVPIAALIHFGDPEWYRTKVVPVYSCGRSLLVFTFIPLPQYRDKLFPADRANQVSFLPLEKLVYIFLSFTQQIPKNQNGVREELARIKAERLVKQAQREAEEINSKS